MSKAIALFCGEIVSRLSFIAWKLSRLLATLPILGTLDTNIPGKTFTVTAIRETAKLFHHETGNNNIQYENRSNSVDIAIY